MQTIERKKIFFFPLNLSLTTCHTSSHSHKGDLQRRQNVRRKWEKKTKKSPYPEPKDTRGYMCVHIVVVEKRKRNERERKCGMSFSLAWQDLKERAHERNLRPNLKHPPSVSRSHRVMGVVSDWAHDSWRVAEGRREALLCFYTILSPALVSPNRMYISYTDVYLVKTIWLSHSRI